MLTELAPCSACGVCSEGQHLLAAAWEGAPDKAPAAWHGQAARVLAGGDAEDGLAAGISGQAECKCTWYLRAVSTSVSHADRLDGWLQPC